MDKIAPSDFALGFTVPDRNVRGRIVRLSGTLRDVIGAHDYPPPIENLLAEALILGALLGAMLKPASDPALIGQLTIQAQTDSGVVRLLVCDYQDGAVRGYVQFDAEALAMAGTQPSLFALFGKGYLAITFDQPVPGQAKGEQSKGRYQGIVPIDGASLAEAAEHYFDQSEQIPSLVRIAVTQSAEGCTASGLLLQHLPEGEVGRERLHVRKDHPDWELVETLGRSVKDDELDDASLAADSLLWRLFHDAGEIRTVEPIALRKGCRCNPAHITDVLSRFPEEERLAMREPDGMIKVDCAFCSRIFEIAV
jgi:molecular chaperone Hsp33